MKIDVRAEALKSLANILEGASTLVEHVALIQPELENPEILKLILAIEIRLNTLGDRITGDMETRDEVRRKEIG